MSFRKRDGGGAEATADALSATIGSACRPGILAADRDDLGGDGAPASSDAAARCRRGFYGRGNGGNYAPDAIVRGSGTGRRNSGKRGWRRHWNNRQGRRSGGTHASLPPPRNAP